MAGRTSVVGRLVLAVFVGGVTIIGAWLAPRSAPLEAELPLASRAVEPAPTSVVPAPNPVASADIAAPRLFGPEGEPADSVFDLLAPPAPIAPDERTIAVDDLGAVFAAADPAIVRDGGVWRVFTTQEYLVNVPVWESTDGEVWTSLGDALPALPPWARWGQTWAPDAIEIDGAWVLYFSALVAGSERHCIGHAVADEAAGPYEAFPEPLVCEFDEGGSIDPSVFESPTGERFLLWKVDANAIGADSVLRSQQLDDAGVALVGEPADLLVHGAPGEWPLIEQPEMIEVDGVHHLLYAAGWWESSGYQVRHAVCEGPSGPCERVGTEPWIATELGFEGPGALSLEPHDDGFVGVYHVWLAGIDDGSFRSMIVARIEFIDGRPGVVRN